MSQTLSRNAAARTTQLTRAAAVVFGVGAVALGLSGLPDRAEPASPGAHGVPPGMPEPSRPSAARPAETEWASVDSAGLAARLALVSNAPKIQRAEEPVSFQEPPEPADRQDERVQDGIADRVRYLGMVRFGEERGALLRVDGRQRIVREGHSIHPPGDSPGMATLTIERISAGTVVIGDGDGRAPVGLERRRGPSVTMADGGIINRTEEVDEVSAEANPRNLPQRELDRRQRMIERQRSGELGNNTRSAVQRPPVNRTFNMRDARPNTQREDQDR